MFRALQCMDRLDRMVDYCKLQGAVATVGDVKSTQQYVLHVVTLDKGSISVGDTVDLSIDRVGFRICSFTVWCI